MEAMQVNVSARHGHLKAGDQQLIVEKSEKLRRFFDRINAIEVTVDLEHQEKPTLEFNIYADGSHDFVASASSTTVQAALDLAIEKVEQQLRKHKERITDHKVAGHKHLEIPDREG
ncbi:MAG: ribosome hibernation-promoting factor, HPF/YfiA family [Pirellulaceae bacterium]